MKKVFLLFQLLVFFQYSWSQSLLDELNSEFLSNADTIFAEATFKATRLINGQSIETVGKNGLNFIISHRFGNLNKGYSNFYGLDESHIRLGLEYGLFDRFDIGLGRSREQQLVDGYIKYKILRQASGAYIMPVTVSYYSAAAIRTDKGLVVGRHYTVANRLNYVHELLIARKFSNSFSLQLMPGIVHRNLTAIKKSPNIVPFVGVGGRLKLSSRITLNAEYYYNLSKYIADNYVNPLSIGFDIETGGHVFQLHFSNSRAMHEKILIPENTNDWLKGDFGFGFNIIRHFGLNN